MNLYKKFCLEFIGALFLCLLVNPILFYLNFGVEDSPGRTINNWLKIKESYAKIVPPPLSKNGKLFVMGSSGVRHGVMCEEIEKKLNVQAVNFGLTGPLQKYQFDRVKNSLSSGDIVLLINEYHLYADHSSWSKYFDSYYIFVMEYDTDYYKNLPTFEKIKFMYHLNTKFLFKRLIARYTEKDDGTEDAKFLAQGEKTSDFMNKNGDITDNTVEMSTYKKPETPEKNALPLKKYPGDEMSIILKNFAEYCRKNNIKLYVTWQAIYPITDKNRFYGHDLEAVNNIKNFWSNLNVEVLGNYYDAFCTAEECYNSESHLNDKGREKYTAHLIELLKPCINN